jgi:hypothetical protein
MTRPPDAEPDDILDDLFHGCAFAAYVELAVACGGVPDMEATRLLAFRYYEEELARKHCGKKR